MVLICPECSSTHIDVDDPEYPSTWLCIDCGRAMPYEQQESYGDVGVSDDFDNFID